MRTYTKLIYAGIWLLAALCFGCEKEMVTYDGKDGIYLPFVSQTMGTAELSFADYHSDTLAIVLDIRVKIMGNVTDFDRPFVIKAIENDTMPALVGVDYEILDQNPVIRKGEAETVVRVKFIRTKELQETTKIIEFSLVENEYFSLLVPKYYNASYTRLVFKINEKIYKPWWWSYYGEDRFGRWTKTKGILVCDLLNIPRTDWNEMEGKVTTAYLTFACRYVYDYLEQQKKAGDPVYDEPLPDTTERPLMEMGNMANPE